ncbi:tetratricopeptide repeat protein [Glycomyces sp. TRM65418]|uniref:tetratricopeptide repeat protein n=1 Tax=Glycomyces sp. TRM65418 TaxID=2867006 RepID=UPI001CE5FDEA|nr:tetratricopeptide repeat protein [Glycomyces sp. TRM65418]MCC3763088.1 tetratricopeptide repeat protein [Glycomyces sp. TRM65418]QZD57097.1 tetratricopeptide repeat protein [Glycomyces sp. TRM65418]
MSTEQHQITELIATGSDGRMYATEPERLRRLVRSELARASRLSPPELRQAGVGLIALGEYTRAQRVLAEALDRADTPHRRVAALVNLGDAHRYPGGLAEAEPLYREAIALARAECPGALHFALQHYGKHLIDARRPHRAVEVLTDVLAMRRRLGDPALVASTEEALSAARAAVGERTI